MTDYAVGVASDEAHIRGNYVVSSQHCRCISDQFMQDVVFIPAQVPFFSKSRKRRCSFQKAYRIRLKELKALVKMWCVDSPEHSSSKYSSS